METTIAALSGLLLCDDSSSVLGALENIDGAVFKATSRLVQLELQECRGSQILERQTESSERVDEALADLLRGLGTGFMVDDEHTNREEKARVILALFSRFVTLSSKRRCRIVSRILRWLISLRPEMVLRCIAVDILGSEVVDRRVKLAAVNCISGCFRDSELTQKCVTSDETASEVKDLFVDIFPSVAFAVAKRYSSRKEDNRYCSPTRLAVCAGDLFIEVILRSCEQISAAMKQQVLKAGDRDAVDFHCDMIKVHHNLILRYVELVLEWNLAAGLQNPHLYVIGISDLLSRLKDICNAKSFGRSASMAFAANVLCADIGLQRSSECSSSKSSAEDETSSCIYELRKIPLCQELGDSNEDVLKTRQFDELARLQCRRLCLLIGKLNKSIYEQVMRSVSAELLEATAKQLQRKIVAMPYQTPAKGLSNSMDLATSLVGHCIDYVLSRTKSPSGGPLEESIVSVYSPIVNMLEEKDMASQCCIHIIAHGAYKYPKELIPTLLGILASSSTLDQRINVLRVLKDLMALIGNSDGLPNEYFLETILDRLIELMKSDSHRLRESAGNVLSAMRPKFAVPRICRAVLKHDLENCSNSADSRTAAIIALAACYRNQANTFEVFQHFLSSLTISDDDNVHVTKQTERLLDSATRWAPEVPHHLWPRLAEHLVEKMFSEPRVSSYVGLLRRLAQPWIEKYCLSSDTDSSLIKSRVLVAFESTRELNEAFLADDVSGDEVQQLLFERLSPLLFLRTLSCDFFASQVMLANGWTNQIASMLLYRMIAVYEFQDIRRMAAEVFGRLPVSEIVWPCVIAVLESLLTAKDTDITVLPLSLKSALKRFEAEGIENQPIFPADIAVAKAMIASSCSALFSSPESCIPVRLLDLISSIFSLSLPSAEHEVKTLRQLQEGCTQLLSQSVVSSSRVWGNKQKMTNGERKLIDDILESSEFDDSESFLAGPDSLERVLLLRNKSPYFSVKICVNNALIQAIREMANRANILPALDGAKGSENIQLTEDTVALSALLSSNLMEDTIQIIGFCSFEGSTEVLRFLASCLQLLFTSLFMNIKLCSSRVESLRKPPLSIPMFKQISNIGIAALSSTDSIVRTAGLKLVGIILSLLSDDLYSLQSGNMGTILNLLRGIVNVDPDRQARQLAQNLLETMNI